MSDNFSVKEPVLPLTESDVQLFNNFKRKDGKTMRPPNAYFIFMKFNRKQVTDTYPTMASSEVCKMLTLIWDLLPYNIKSTYMKYSIELCKIHTEMFPDYVFNPNLKRRQNTRFRASIEQPLDSPIGPVEENVFKVSLPTPLFTPILDKWGVKRKRASTDADPNEKEASATDMVEEPKKKRARRTRTTGVAVTPVTEVPVTPATNETAEAEDELEPNKVTAVRRGPPRRCKTTAPVSVDKGSVPPSDYGKRVPAKCNAVKRVRSLKGKRQSGARRFRLVIDASSAPTPVTSAASSSADKPLTDNFMCQKVDIFTTSGTTTISDSSNLHPLESPIVDDCFVAYRYLGASLLSTTSLTGFVPTDRETGLWLKEVYDGDASLSSTAVDSNCGSAAENAMEYISQNEVGIENVKEEFSSSNLTDDAAVLVGSGNQDCDEASFFTYDDVSFVTCEDGGSENGEES